jgi:predicted transposase/invertase (TIGR01784 family)
MAPLGPKEPNNPHDALFRRTFSSVEHAAAELRAVLPSELLAHVNLATLSLSSGSYVDAELASSQSDLLFTVELQNRPGFLYLLFEHQSSAPPLMPLRILKYVVRILDQHVVSSGEGAEALPLPVVIPVVLHHSTKGWTAATRMEDLFDAELVAEPSIRALVPRLSFVLDDISHLTDDQLTQRALGLVPTLTLWALRDARHRGRVQQALSRWAAVIQALAQAESGREALMTIFRYLSLVAQDLTPQALLTSLAAVTPEAKETFMTTLAELWTAEGEARGEARGRVEGEARGRVEGEARGRVEGARRVLLQLLQLKFGELPSSERARVQAASEEELLRWTARLLTADSLAAVLAD